MIKTIEQYLNRYNNDVKQIMTGVNINIEDLNVAVTKSDILQGVVIGYNMLSNKEVGLKKNERLGSRENRVEGNIFVEEICTYSIIVN